MVEKISFTVVSKKKNDLGIKPNEKCSRPIWKNNLKAHLKDKKSVYEPTERLTMYLC